MAEVVAKVGIKREPGYLYYLGKDGNVWGTPMQRKGQNATGSAKKMADSNIERQEGFLYFIDKDGNVARSKMTRGAKKK